MSENKQSVYREKTLERISSPEHLTDYLRVSNPGIWVILAAVMLLLAGIFAWAMIGNLETTAQVKVLVKNHTAQIVSVGAEELKEGMPLRVAGQECRIVLAEADDYGRPAGKAEIMLPDGTYTGTVVTETVHPISFLLESR